VDRVCDVGRQCAKRVEDPRTLRLEPLHLGSCRAELALDLGKLLLPSPLLVGVCGLRCLLGLGDDSPRFLVCELPLPLPVRLRCQPQVARLRFRLGA
jgi:hypothetical protein